MIPIRTVAAGVAALAPLGCGVALAAPALNLPLACTIGRDCEVQHYVDRQEGPGVRDYRCASARSYEGHNGVDIRLLSMAQQRAGVSVLAAADGRVSRVRDGEPDISIRATGAPAVNGRECGNGVVIDHGDGWETQYCHLAKGSVAAVPGQAVKAGAPIARVGLSGATEFPHLHFTVRHNGQVVDPFAPAAEPKACGMQAPLWSKAALTQLSYKAGVILNVGFAPGTVDMAVIEGGQIPRPTRSSPWLVAYGRAIGLEAGDVVEMQMSGPAGVKPLRSAQPPLDRNKAQTRTIIGQRRPAAAWPAGTYRATYSVRRGGKIVLSRQFDITL